MFNIAELKQIRVSDHPSSWEIGELISDGWFELEVIDIGSSPIHDYEFDGVVAILGRPRNIMHINRDPIMCLPLIRSGRQSVNCKLGTMCSVEGCSNSADYEVIFYDYYPNTTIVQFDQDYTCPFICEDHMQENEREAIGTREPRSFINYPYTKLHGGQAYTKYLPVKK